MTHDVIAVRRVVPGLLAALVMAALIVAAPARAGQWIQVSCVNPDGTVAPSEGWSGSGSQAGPGSNNSTGCSPGSPMAAALSGASTDPVGADEVLQYQPPAGSTLSGGTIQVGLSADGDGPSASAVAAVYEPRFAYDGSDVFFQCANGQSPCSGGAAPDDFSGQLTLPVSRGGDLFLGASCGGAGGGTCTSAPTGVYSQVQVFSADLLLSNGAAPTGTDMSGSALQGPIQGTGHLVFTAADAGGPGVYLVTATLDGHVVYSATPNTNSGECTSVGASGGVLMFDWQQPCPVTEVDDVPVPTAGLPDGPHQLVVTVTDAAGNASNVVDQTITSSNPQVTPKPASPAAVHAQFVINWHWVRRTTVIRRITVRHLPRQATVRVSCTGRRCPRLRPDREGARKVKRLLTALRGKRFHPGETLHLTVTQRSHRAERIELIMRNNKMPTARSLTR
jgi:hypothetical protein